MTRVKKPDLDPVKDRISLSIITGFKKLDRRLRILNRIDRSNRFPACPLCFPVFPLGFIFLNMGGIPKHDIAKFCGRLGRVDRLIKTSGNQCRDLSGVVNMGMS